MSFERILSVLLHSATTLAFSAGASRGFSHHEHLFAPSSRGKLEELTETPSKLFNSILCILILATVLFKMLERWTHHAMRPTKTRRNNHQSRAIKSLQARFLAVFWLIKCADWLQGPYFYELYASKVSSCSIISKLFVTGFASAALFGPLAARISDTFGRKRATLAFCVLYSLGAASTKSSSLYILFLGRLLSGIGTSLMFTAPEGWLVAKLHDKDPKGSHLEETFGLAYAVDSIVAIAAGQLSLAAASHRGLTGPFELSIVFLCIGGLLVLFLWSENVASRASDENKNHKPLIQDALHLIYKNPAILLLGAAQSLFEACMYIFIMQWPPSINDAVHAAYGSTAETPYGTVLSCFMASCLIGATLFGHLSKLGIPTEESTALMLTVAALVMGSATTAVSAPTSPSLASLIISYLAFEGCVGMYFPSTSALRCKYIPDAHRSIIMSLFGIPLNVLVVSVFLANERLGVRGALGMATAFLNVAAMSMYKLHSMKRRKSPTITFK